MPSGAWLDKLDGRLCLCDRAVTVSARRRSEGQLDEIAHALADDTRRRLLDELRRRPGLSTGELATASAGLSRWGVMKHLGVLRDAGLVQTLPEGRRRRHYHDPRTLEPLRRWLAGGER